MKRVLQIIFLILIIMGVVISCNPLSVYCSKSPFDSCLEYWYKKKGDKMKKLLSVFLVLNTNTLALAKETENIDIFVNPNVKVKVSQNELNND